MTTRRTRQSRRDPTEGRTEGPTVVSRYNTRSQRAVRGAPYRVAVKKSTTTSTESSIDVVSVFVPQPVTTSLHCNFQSHDDEITLTAGDRLGNHLRNITTASDGVQANLGARLLSVGRKINPMMLVLLSTVLATPVLVGICLNKYNNTGSDFYGRYEKFSYEMLQLQKQYTHQSAWLWHGLRITAWLSLTEPLPTMPMALLVAIPHGYEKVGRSIATKAVDSFNKVHGQRTTVQVSCGSGKSSRDYNQSETVVHAKQLSLAVGAARRAHQSAVLIYNLEKLAHASLPILDRFLDIEDHRAQNKMLIFTINVPETANCTPDYVRRFLVEDWISLVFSRPTIARKLVDNVVFITPYAANGEASEFFLPPR